MVVEALFFDLYGTLTVRVPDGPSGPGPGRVLIAAVGDLDMDASTLNADTVLDELWQFAVLPQKGEGTPFEMRLAGFLNSRLHCDLSPPDLREAADAVCAEWERGYHVDPQAHPVLERLGESFPLGLVSNFDHPPHVHRQLSWTGLQQHFATIVVSGDVGTQKPEPEILRIACDRINAAVERCAYVGDSIVDYRAAGGAGMSFFWIRRPPIQGLTESPTDDAYRETDAELETLAETGRISRIASLIDLLPEFGNGLDAPPS